jgi:transaldolase/fructose-6-phosphate aldolase-like protein
VVYMSSDKAPATREGLPAVERCLTEGLNVNITLLFSVERYIAVAEAYLRALETRAARNRQARPMLYGSHVEHATGVVDLVCGLVAEPRGLPTSRALFDLRRGGGDRRQGRREGRPDTAH